MDATDRSSTVRRAAAVGSDLTLEAFRHDVDVETKSGPLDTVTAVDRAAQRQIVETIEARHPDEPVVAEEDDAPATVPDSGPAWVVDPIDGTNNFVVGDRVWAVAVATTDGGESVAATVDIPAIGDTYHAATGGTTRNGDRVTVSDRSDPQTFTVGAIFGAAVHHRNNLLAALERIVETFGDLRRIGCGQATLARVASGELDAAVSTMRLDPWDTVAGVHLVRSAGGVVTDLDGRRWRHDSSGLAASNGVAHDAVVDAFSSDYPRSCEKR